MGSWDTWPWDWKLRQRHQLVLCVCCHSSWSSRRRRFIVLGRSSIFWLRFFFFFFALRSSSSSSSSVMWDLVVGFCAFFWIFCVAVGGVDGSGIWVCYWWWWWNWVWVWILYCSCRVTQVREEDSWKRLIGGLHHFGKRWT